MHFIYYLLTPAVAQFIIKFGLTVPTSYTPLLLQVKQHKNTLQHHSGSI